MKTLYFLIPFIPFALQADNKKLHQQQPRLEQPTSSYQKKANASFDAFADFSNNSFDAFQTNDSSFNEPAEIDNDPWQSFQDLKEETSANSNIQ